MLIRDQASLMTITKAPVFAPSLSLFSLMVYWILGALLECIKRSNVDAALMVPRSECNSNPLQVSFYCIKTHGLKLSLYSFFFEGPMPDT